LFGGLIEKPNQLSGVREVTQVKRGLRKNSDEQSMVRRSTVNSDLDVRLVEWMMLMNRGGKRIDKEVR